MPYGIDPALWRRLPADDQIAIAAEATGQPIPAVGGYAPAPAAAPQPVVVSTPATTAPPPTLSGAAAARTNTDGEAPPTTSVVETVTKPKPPVKRAASQPVWTLASREARLGRIAVGADADESRTRWTTARKHPRTETNAKRLPASTESEAWAMRSPTLDFVQKLAVGSSIAPPPSMPPKRSRVRDRELAMSRKPPNRRNAAPGAGRINAETTSSAASAPGNPFTAQHTPTRRLTDVAPGHVPDEDPLRTGYDTVEQVKKAIEAIHLREAPSNADKEWRRWVELHWVGAAFTIAQLQKALSLVKIKTFYPLGKAAAEAFARANPPATPNPLRVTYLAEDAAAALIRRAWAISSDIARMREASVGSIDPTRAKQRLERIRTLEGALSATGLALAIVDYSVRYVIPDAGKYVGAGNPADALKAAFGG